MKRLLGVCGSLVTVGTYVVGIAAEPGTSARQESQVTINAEYDTYSNSEGFGFVLIVNRWEPRATAEMAPSNALELSAQRER